MTLSARLSDHGTHEAVYLSDPDGNDLDLDDLLAEPAP